MFELIPTFVSVLSALLLGLLIIKMYKFERELPDFKQIFDNLGGDISATFKEIVTNPTVKASFTAMGKKSGEARASTALRNRAAKAVMGQTPALGMIAKQLGFSELEAISLMNDPIFGPLIQKGIAAAQGALSKAGGGGGGPVSGGRVGYG